MNAEMISDLDKRLSIQEATLTRVLEAQERAANSTEKLNISVTEMTSELRYTRQHLERAQNTADEALDISNQNKTEIAIMKSGGKWKEWAGQALTSALVVSALGAIALFMSSK